MRTIVMYLTAALLLTAPAWALRGEGPQPAGKTDTSQTAFAPGELLVRFTPGTPARDREIQHLSVGAENIRTFEKSGVHHILLPKGMTVQQGIKMYEANPNVEFAEPNFMLRAIANIPNDTLFGSQWALDNAGNHDIDAPEAWDIITGASSVVVAVIDSGIDYNHPDLRDNIWTNSGEIYCTDNIDNDGNGYVDDCYGWDFVGPDYLYPSPDNDPMDDDGHGTHVAGIIGAVGNNAKGVTGMAWSVKLMPLKFLDSYGLGWVSDAISAIEYADKMGADIVNCSWGGYGYSSSLKSAIDASSALFVCAAGNDTENTDIYEHYPSSFQSDNIISVAATRDDDTLASYSNFGALSVDVGAPGGESLGGGLILSTYPNPFFDDFDDGDMSGWTQDGTNTWSVTPSAYTSPPYSLITNASGNYPDNADIWARSPAFDLSDTSLLNCELDYALALDLADAGDQLLVEASTNGVTFPTTLATFTGPANTGFSNQTADLSGYEGDSIVYIRFSLISNSSGNADGAYIDDVSVACYANSSGTSMATPHVSGVAALVMANTPALDVLQTRHIIINTVDPVTGLNGKTVSGGRVNAYTALMADLSALPPVAPSSLKAKSVSNTAVNLTWQDNSPYEDGYYIERKDGSPGTFIQIDTALVNTTSYKDTGLVTGLRYTYRIQAFSNTTGTSPYSNEASAVPASSSDDDGGGGSWFSPGCFIATAAYGSPLADEVEALRRFRDEHLLTNTPGRKLVELYYRLSPPAARYIAKYPAWRAAARAGLTPVIFMVKHPVRASVPVLVIISVVLIFAIHLKRRRSCN